MNTKLSSIKLISTTSLLLTFLFSITSLAKDFSLRTLPQAQNPTFDLKSFASEMSYYDFVHTQVGLKMLEVSDQAKPSRTNERELKAGNGVSVKLSKNNYNVHINFPDQATGGRSYGWTAGKVGDWSDAMYLDKLFEIVNEENLEDMSLFYKSIIKMLGASNPEDIESLSNSSQRVAANFLAIYTAEQYRSMVPNDPHRNWDDALLEATLLGAFHGGQSDFSMFYLGDFTTETKAQGSGVYAKTKPGPTADEAKDKSAEMRDYWQFSANPDSKQSGINITRFDFEKMGEAITEYEVSIARNSKLAKIHKIVGGDKGNIIKAISKFFSAGKSKDITKINELAELVSAFMLDLHKDANKISKWLEDQDDQ